MKPRHAAALALVGWYLIAPPPRTVDDVIDPKAPLSQWQIIGRFDTVKECYDYPAHLREIMRDFPNISESERRKDEAAQNSLMAQSQCIPTDDPRLKEK